MTKEELNERLLFFNPEIVFDGTPGGIKLQQMCEKPTPLDVGWIAQI